MRVTLSRGRSCSGEDAQGFLTGGSLSGSVMLPETSTRKTRLAGGRFFFGGVLRLNAGFDEFGFRSARGIDGLGVDGEGRPSVGGVGIGEVVDDFFDAHGVFGRQAAVEEAAHENDRRLQTESESR